MLHLQTLFDAAIVTAQKKRIRESPSLSPTAGIDLQWAKPIKSFLGSEHCLINRETAFMYPGLFTIWITSLGAFPMLPVGCGITPGCKGLFHNVHPSKSSNLALSEASAQRVHVSITETVTSARELAEPKMSSFEEEGTRVSWGPQRPETSTPNSPAHFSCLNKGWLLMSNVLLHRLATHPLWRSTCSQPPEKGAAHLAIQQTWLWLHCWSFMPALLVLQWRPVKGLHGTTVEKDLRFSCNNLPTLRQTRVLDCCCCCWPSHPWGQTEHTNLTISLPTEEKKVIWGTHISHDWLMGTPGRSVHCFVKLLSFELDYS